MRITPHTVNPLATLMAGRAHAAVAQVAPRPNPAAEQFASIFSSAGKTAAASTGALASTPAASSPAPASTPATVAAPAPTAPAASTAATVQTPGLQALVSAMQNGTLQVSYVTDPNKLLETTPAGTDHMPNFYYASDETANQIAQLLGGTVVQRPAFGQVAGFNEPLANFVQLPNGMTVNAADLAYYARCGKVGTAQLTADLTATINEGAAWTNWYINKGPMPIVSTGYVGPPVPGMTYPAGTIGSDGNVINPAMSPTNS